jgi:hypothetical protein
VSFIRYRQGDPALESSRQYTRKRREYIKYLTKSPEGKRPHGRPRSTWKGNIKINLINIGWVVVEWIN